jgi:hypothetical protein
VPACIWGMVATLDAGYRSHWAYDRRYGNRFTTSACNYSSYSTPSVTLLVLQKGHYSIDGSLYHQNSNHLIPTCSFSPSLPLSSPPSDCDPSVVCFVAPLKGRPVAHLPRAASNSCTSSVQVSTYRQAARRISTHSIQLLALWPP